MLLENDGKKCDRPLLIYVSVFVEFPVLRRAFRLCKDFCMKHVLVTVVKVRNFTMRRNAYQEPLFYFTIKRKVLEFYGSKPASTIKLVKFCRSNRYIKTQKTITNMSESLQIYNTHGAGWLFLSAAGGIFCGLKNSLLMRVLEWSKICLTYFEICALYF